jgi:hypothetical protein
VVCATTPTCLEGFTNAQRLAKEGQLQEALVIFQALYSEFADPRIYFPIGRMYQRQGQQEQAAAYYQRLLDSGVETDPANLAKVEKFLAEAQAALAAAKPPPAAPVTPSTPPQLERPAEGARKRARWLLGVGIPMSAAGITMLGLGGGALAVNGTCAQTLMKVDAYGSFGSECDRRYNSTPVGIGFTVGGAVLLISGLGMTVAGGVAYRRTHHAALTWRPARPSTQRMYVESHD